MAFQLKYWYRFKDLNNQAYTLNILENSETAITPQEIGGAQNPFSVQYPDIGSKFSPVRGSGSTLNVVSESDQQFIGMYTADMMQYKCELYKDAALVWTGYLDSELYSEPFGELNNYFVSLKANDGFNLLDRLNYVDNTGAYYSGIVTQWQVLTNVLTKLGLNWNAVYVGLSTTIDGITLGAGETIFHRTYAIQENYYNEDNKPETCRTVLEGILKPYGAFIQQVNGALYISDLNHVATSPATYLKYNSSFSFLGNESINTNIGDLSTIGIISADNRDTINGVNYQVVTYSPYRQGKPIDYTAKEEDFSNPETPTSYGSGDYTWNETLYGNSKVWIKHNNGKFAKLEATAGSKEGDTRAYLKINRYNGTIADSWQSFSTAQPLPYIIPSAGYYLRIDINALFRTKVDYENPTDTGTGINFGMIYLKIKIGDKYYIRLPQGQFVGWRSEVVGGYNYYALPFYKITDYKVSGSVTTYTYGLINDQFVTASFQKMFADKSITQQPPLIPLGAGFAGNIMEFKILGWRTGNNINGIDDDATTLATIDCRIDSIKLAITDSAGNEVENNDLEYEGFLNEKFKNPGEAVSLIHGTNAKKIPCERAGLLGYTGTNYYFLDSWTREGISAKLEELLLRSIISNYEFPSLKISATINSPGTLFGYLTYSNFLSGKKMIVSGATIDFEQAETQCTLTEFSKDTATI